MENNELMHWGVKGMKWGIRRYQNKDGTLTAAGKKRYIQEMERLKKEEKILKNKQRTKAQLDKLEAKRKEIDDQKKALSSKSAKDKSEHDGLDKKVGKNTGKKKIKDMTDEELNAAITRMKLEKSYKELMAEQNANGKDDSSSRGKSFVKTVWDKSVKPALTEATKDAIKKAISVAVDKKLGVNSSKDDKKDKSK